MILATAHREDLRPDRLTPNYSLFRSIPFFRSLSDEELYQMSDKLVMKRFMKNETILYEHDTNSAMYILLEGRVKVVQITEDGKEIILAFHQAGDFFGEMSLIDGKTSPATVIATAESTAAIIHRNDFFSLLHSQKTFLQNLLQVFCCRLRVSWDRIQMLNFKNPAQRVKSLLLMLSEVHGQKTRDGIILTIKLSHQDIASMTGLTRETVTRAIDKWQREGEIDIPRYRCLCMRPSFFEGDSPLAERPFSRFNA